MSAGLRTILIFLCCNIKFTVIVTQTYLETAWYGGNPNGLTYTDALYQGRISGISEWGYHTALWALVISSWQSTNKSNSDVLGWDKQTTVSCSSFSLNDDQYIDGYLVGYGNYVNYIEFHLNYGSNKWCKHPSFDSGSVPGNTGLVIFDNPKRFLSGFRAGHGAIIDCIAFQFTDIALLPTYTPTINPTLTPTHSTHNPTTTPTMPSISPSKYPTEIPSLSPTKTPTKYPTNIPTNIPSNTPSFMPTSGPSNNPSESPTRRPTQHQESESEIVGYTTDIQQNINQDSLNKSNEQNINIWIYVVVVMGLLLICCAMIMFIKYFRKKRETKINSTRMQQENVQSATETIENGTYDHDKTEVEHVNETPFDNDTYNENDNLEDDDDENEILGYLNATPFGNEIEMENMENINEIVDGIDVFETKSHPETDMIIDNGEGESEPTKGYGPTDGENL